MNYISIFKSHRFTVQNWFAFHYRWEIWINSYCYEQSNKIWLCPGLFFFSYLDTVPQRLWEISSETLNMVCIFQVSILTRKAMVDCQNPVCWGKELLHFVSEGDDFMIKYTEIVFSIWYAMGMFCHIKALSVKSEYVFSSSECYWYLVWYW